MAELRVDEIRIRSWSKLPKRYRSWPEATVPTSLETKGLLASLKANLLRNASLERCLTIYRRKLEYRQDWRAGPRLHPGLSVTSLCAGWLVPCTV